MNHSGKVYFEDSLSNHIEATSKHFDESIFSRISGGKKVNSFPDQSQGSSRSSRIIFEKRRKRNIATEFLENFISNEMADIPFLEHGSFFSNISSVSSIKKSASYNAPIRISDGTNKILQLQKRNSRNACPSTHVCCTKPVIPSAGFQSRQGECGVRFAKGITGRVRSLFGNGESEFGEYPWQAAILKKEGVDNVYVCGGTLVDRIHILTAAHCIKNPEQLRIRLGEWDVNHDTEFYPHVENDVSRIMVHPEFYSGNLQNDIALIRMLRPVDSRSTPHISSACFPNQEEEFNGQRCWVTGWGKDGFGNNGQYSNILKEVDVPVLSNFDCENRLKETRLGYNFNLHPGFLCAGGEPGKDACKGDGGGPLICERGGRWLLAGIVSWGIGCGQPNVPGIYVKVSYYKQWIDKMMFSN